MKAKANVLQVMDTIIHEISWHSDIRAAELSEARAAVAELIEAASPVCMALHASRMIMADKESREYAGEICDRLKAALANVGGAK